MAYHVLSHFKNGVLLEDLEQDIQWDETIIPRNLIAPGPAPTAQSIVLPHRATTAHQPQSSTIITPGLQENSPETHQPSKLDQDGRILTQYKGKGKEGAVPRLNEVAQTSDIPIFTPTTAPTNDPNDLSQAENPAASGNAVVGATKRK